MCSSPNCRMPSPLTSETDIRLGSTLCQLAIQLGNWSNGVPTSEVKISNFTSTASAGAVM